MSMPEPTNDRCIACGNRYRGSSRPRRVLVADGREIGTAHTSCKLRKGQWGFDLAGTSLEDARFMLWAYYLQAPLEGRSDESLAISLGDRGLDDELNDEQLMLLDWWIWKGGMKLGEARRQPIIDAYHAMRELYRQWRSQVPDGEIVHA